MMRATENPSGSKKEPVKRGRPTGKSPTKKNRIIIKDFSAVENNPQGAVSSIRLLAGFAGKRAALAAKSMGLPKIYATQKEIIRVSADGSIREILVTTSPERKAFYSKYTKGTVFHARKK